MLDRIFNSRCYSLAIVAIIGVVWIGCAVYYIGSR